MQFELCTGRKTVVVVVVLSYQLSQHLPERSSPNFQDL